MIHESLYQLQIFTSSMLTIRSGRSQVKKIRSYVCIAFAGGFPYLSMHSLRFCHCVNRCGIIALLKLKYYVESIDPADLLFLDQGAYLSSQLTVLEI